MFPLGRNSIRLFRIAGIDVFLHWSWFLVALIEIQSRANAYTSLTWNVLEYATLFLIVLLHEFGHALACRQVGGTAEQIVLWPLGGVAYVSPPPRPTAMLWSIVAGPLVNVALIPVFLIIGAASQTLGIYQAMPSFHPFLHAVATINVTLLLFNILPIYPLDGGKIVWSLLWFVLGTCAQPHGCHDHRIRWRGRFHRRCICDSLDVAGCFVRIFSIKLLDCPAPRILHGAARKGSAPSGLCMSRLQSCAAHREPLALPAMQEIVRYVCCEGSVP